MILTPEQSAMLATPYPLRTPVNLFSVFHSIDGEVNAVGQGCPSTFVRFSGCNLRCGYCDSGATWEVQASQQVNVGYIVNEVLKIGCPKVTITGGEPLMQTQAFIQLVLALTSRGHTISCETNGSLPPPILHPKLSYVVDVKLPSSGMWSRMPEASDPIWLTWGRQSPAFLKYVISDFNDFEFALAHLTEVRHNAAAAGADAPWVALSPVMHGTGTVGIGMPTFMNWLREAELFDVIVNFQIHKMLELVEDNPGETL
jgi:7-carboxy-7-deazaguanine synthase